jgi:hypothetical protein
VASLAIFVTKPTAAVCRPRSCIHSRRAHLADVVLHTLYGSLQQCRLLMLSGQAGCQVRSTCARPTHAAQHEAAEAAGFRRNARQCKQHKSSGTGHQLHTTDEDNCQMCSCRLLHAGPAQQPYKFTQGRLMLCRVRAPCSFLKQVLNSVKSTRAQSSTSMQQ